MLALFPNGILLFPSNISVKKTRKIHSPTPNFFCAICGKNLPYMIKFRISTQIEIGMLTGCVNQFEGLGFEPPRRRFVRVVRYSEECPDYKNPKTSTHG